MEKENPLFTQDEYKLVLQALTDQIYKIQSEITESKVALDSLMKDAKKNQAAIDNKKKALEEHENLLKSWGSLIKKMENKKFDLDSLQN